MASCRVCVNARFVTQSLTGVQRYGYEIALRLPQLELIAPAAPAGDYAGLQDRANLTVSDRVAGVRLSGHAWEQLALPAALGRDRLLWSPGGIGPIAVRRQVVTIHDVAHIEHPEWYSRGFAMTYRALYPVLTRQVRAIMTVSHFSKERIVTVLGVPEDKVIVTPSGLNDLFRRLPDETVRSVLDAHQVTGPYLLAVSAVSSRKNVQRIYRAWNLIADDYPEVSLVIVGATKLAFSDLKDVGELPKRAKYLGRLSDEELVAVYNGALGFLYPSLYEGFGLPPLEAMACGTPVLSANTTAIPEVSGDAAILVDPLDVEAIAHGLRRLLDDTALRAELQQKGLERAKQYSFDRAAELAWAALERVAEEG